MATTIDLTSEVQRGDTIHTLLFPSSPASDSGFYAPSSSASSESVSSEDSDPESDSDMEDASSPASSCVLSLRALREANMRGPTLSLRAPTHRYPTTMTIILADPPRALLAKDSTRANPLFGSSVKFAHEIAGVFSEQWSAGELRKTVGKLGSKVLVEWKKTVDVPALDDIHGAGERKIEVKLLAWRGGQLVGGWLVGEYTHGEFTMVTR